MTTHHFTILFSLLLLVSCASDKKQAAATPEPRKSLSERLGEKNGYKQDAEGNWIPQSDRRSPYENAGATYDSKKSFQKKAYKAEGYTKKSFWGNKQYDRQAYSGDTDGSRFQQSSALQGENAPESGSNARIPGNYQTDNYATNSAREAGNKPIPKTGNAAIESRQKKFQQPEIIGWQEQRSLSLDQSKGILGR